MTVTAPRTFTWRPARVDSIDSGRYQFPTTWRAHTAGTLFTCPWVAATDASAVRRSCRHEFGLGHLLG